MDHGNEWVSLGYLSMPDNFEITWPEEPERPEMLGLDPGEILSFQVVPEAGLDVGRYSETFTVYANLMAQPRAMSALTERSAEEEGYLWNTKVEIELSFTVRNRSNGSGGGGGPVSYTLSFETGEGSKVDSVSKVSGTTVDLDDYVSSREGYEFTGWYADEDLTEKITSIRLIRNTTVYAGWEEIKENPSTGFENPFTDVSESDWFFNDVKFVYQNGLMNGTSATTFSPEGTTSRGMIVTILWRMAGSPDMEDKIWGYPFADVDATAYYGTAVYWARLNGIAGGYDDATFGPNDPITREQMAAILYRYAQYKGYDVSAKADLNKFTDADEISNYALEALQWANAEGLINGKGDGVLDPKGQATRAEAAAILTRFCEQYAEK